MSIAFDTASNNGTCGAGSPHTWSHTCTGTNRLLVVAAITVANSDNATAVTYNGISLTKITAKVGSTTSVSLWYLLNPTSGTNTVSVTYSGSPGGSLASSYTGVLQSGQPDSSHTGTATVATTTVLDNTWLVGGFFTGSNDAAAGANTTIRSDNIGGGGHSNGGCGGICDSNALQTPAGSHSLAITGSGEQDMVIASFAPVLIITTSDTEVTSDSASLGLGLGAMSDTSVSSDSATLKIGFGNKAKNSSTVTNRQKS